MSELKSRYLTIKDFQEQIINWSPQTIRRRIRDDGLPAINERGGILFDRKLVEEWFRKRTHRAG